MRVVGGWGLYVVKRLGVNREQGVSLLVGIDRTLGRGIDMLDRKHFIAPSPSRSC